MHAVNASDVVRRFRVWRLQNRPHTKVDDLATEVGIPSEVIKKIMMGVSDAPAYMQRITAFLDAAQHGNQQAMQQIAQASELLPDPHAPTRYSVSVLKALSARQRKLVENDDRPYCVIARAEIAPRQCVISRTSKECVGCSAHTKFCLECGFDRTAFAGSDLCAYCLTIALADPQTDMRTAVLPIKVSCVQSGGQRITIATCNKMQGSACGSCNAATRICTDCKERRVRYPSFGACLHCYTTLMAPDWKPLSEQQMAFQRTQRELFFQEAATHVHEKPVMMTVVPKEILTTATESKYAHLLEAADELHHQSRERINRLVAMMEALPEATEQFVSYVTWHATFAGEGKFFPSKLALDQFINREIKDGPIVVKMPQFWTCYIPRLPHEIPNELRFDLNRIATLIDELAENHRQPRRSRIRELQEENTELRQKLAKAEKINQDLSACLAKAMEVNEFDPFK